MKRNSNGISARVLVMAVALTLIIGGIIGGSVAWLTDKTDPVVNTFTVGDINITLSETTGTNYKIVPGNNITKDPKVEVAANSEDCYLFIKVKKDNWPNTSKISYTMNDGWTELEDGIFYRVVSSSTSVQEFPVISNNTITVESDLTKEELEKMSSFTLTVKAFAVQKDGIDDVDTAWSKIPDTEKISNPV